MTTLDDILAIDGNRAVYERLGMDETPYRLYESLL